MLHSRTYRKRAEMLVSTFERQESQQPNMRLWSIHPKLLDSKGLVALWREGLLARHVLLGMTQGYRNHPQLDRFRQQSLPVNALDSYLSRVLDEATQRSYAFDGGKIAYRSNCRMTVTRGQLEYEWSHLLHKLELRDKALYRSLRRQSPEAHPCFRVVAGPVQAWERITLTKLH